MTTVEYVPSMTTWGSGSPMRWFVSSEMPLAYATALLPTASCTPEHISCSSLI